LGTLRRMSSKRWAALFDWDGVVIDSSRQHEKSWHALAEEERRDLPPGFFLRSFGMKNEKIIPELFHWTTEAGEIRRLSLRKEALYREIIRREHIAALPGVRRLLDELRGGGIPCAIASSTPRANIDAVIEDLGLTGYFEAVVAGEDVTHGKPHPEVFLLAASKLNMPPERCVVLEDAHVGIEAGKAAGMKVVAVATTHAKETLEGADLVLERLTELKLASLEQWFG
jgi:beta-phosphoglucomutase family hydrolase